MGTQNTASVPVAIIVQIENPISPPQWGAPVLYSSCTVVVNETGVSLYPPVHAQRPMGSGEFTDDIMQAVNLQLAKLGLQLVKSDVAN